MMNRDEIIAMALEEGLSFVPDANSPLVRIVRKAVAKEREACAQLVQDKQELDPYAGINGWVAADAIRARGQKEGV